MRLPTSATAVLLAVFATCAAAATIDDAVRPIEHEWAVIQYRTPEQQRAARFEVLAKRAHQVVAANPGKAAPLIWEGIVLSSEAGARGGLGALSLAKAARKALEQALKLDGKALGGSAYTSLGTLYYKLPGWPISFGDNDKAEKLLRQALAINPTGMDPNYFYGDFLLERSRPREALKYLQTALKAPPRPGRELADSGRRKEVRALIAKARKDLGSGLSVTASR